jgi:MraZ protein
VFRGVSVLNLDAKGRLAIPARYREELAASCASRLILTVDHAHCLLVYPEPVWVEIEQKLAALPSFNDNTRSIQRLLIGYATECEMDGQGRILLPAKHIKIAGIDKRVAVVGQGKKLEIWDEDTWDRKTEEWLSDDGLKGLEHEAGIGNLSI